MKWEFQYIYTGPVRQGVKLQPQVCTIWEEDIKKARKIFKKKLPCHKILGEKKHNKRC